jgi:head-tail adaptor
MTQRQVSIEYKSVEQDATYGTDVITWARLDLEPFWADVTDVLPSRSESVQQGLQVARNLTRIRMRWRDDITSAMRVILHGDGTDTVYQIIGGPSEIQGRKKRIELVCEKFSS